MKPRTGAERYIAERLQEPDFAAAYEDARRRIDDVDRIVRTIEDRRIALGLSKAELARRVGVRPEAIRRLLSGHHANPTLSTVMSLASALKLDIVAIPAGEDAIDGDRRSVAVVDTTSTAAFIGGMGTTLAVMESRLIPRTPLGHRLVEHREAILRAAARRHASNVRVFGSVARGEDRPDSDIDLLVDVEPNTAAFDLLELGCDLEEELDVHVDVGTASSLRPFLRDEVLAEALVLRTGRMPRGWPTWWERSTPSPATWRKEALTRVSSMTPAAPG
ncbi:MAG: nucleotidyltransferase domain-containing protein [Acidimicrobiales bacterium]